MNSKNKTMKSTHNSRTTKIVIITLIVLALGLAGYKTYAHFHNKDTLTPVADGPTSEEAKQSAATDAQNKKDFVENNDKSTEPTTTTPTPTSDIAIELTAKRENSTSVTIVAKLPGVSSGTCTLTVVNGSRNTTHTADVIYQPEFSSCAGFSVPVSEVGTGTWSIDLSVTGSSKTGSKSITFEVN